MGEKPIRGRTAINKGRKDEVPNSDSSYNGLSYPTYLYLCFSLSGSAFKQWSICSLTRILSSMNNDFNKTIWLITTLKYVLRWKPNLCRRFQLCLLCCRHSSQINQFLGLEVAKKQNELDILIKLDPMFFVWS